MSYKIKKDLRLVRDNYPIINTGLLIVVIVLLSTLSLRENKTRQIIKVLEKEVSINIVEQPFSEKEFVHYLDEINIRFPEVVYAQAFLETGGFKSEIFLINNNLFGMKMARQRPRTSTGMNRNHAVYNTWRESVLDYALYQSHYLSKIKTQEEYIDAIGRVYAEDPSYKKKVLKIIKEKFD